MASTRCPAASEDVHSERTNDCGSHRRRAGRWRRPRGTRSSGCPTTSSRHPVDDGRVRPAGLGVELVGREEATYRSLSVLRRRAVGEPGRTPRRTSVDGRARCGRRPGSRCRGRPGRRPQRRRRSTGRRRRRAAAVRRRVPTGGAWPPRTSRANTSTNAALPVGRDVEHDVMVAAASAAAAPTHDRRRSVDRDPSTPAPVRPSGWRRRPPGRSWQACGDPSTRRVGRAIRRRDGPPGPRTRAGRGGQASAGG